jgi:imidazoleglycerol phosphate dehydratase HisB
VPRQGALAADLEVHGFFAFIQTEIKSLIHLQKTGQEMHHVAQALSKAYRRGEDLYHLGQKG